MFPRRECGQVCQYAQPGVTERGDDRLLPLTKRFKSGMRLRHIDRNIHGRPLAYRCVVSFRHWSRRLSGVIALDHHLYRCFADSETHTSANEHTCALWDRMLDVFSHVAEKLGQEHGLCRGVVCGAEPTDEADEMKNDVSA